MNATWTRRDWFRAAGLAALYAAAGRSRLDAEEVWRPPPEGKHINLAGNENPFGPSPSVVQRIVRSAPESCRYPFREEYVLKEMLARQEGVPLDHIVLGNGCDEILALCAAAHLAPGSNVVAASPTYFQLPDYARNLGAEVRWVPHRAETMQHDLPAMLAAATRDTKLVYVCNPDNPTGTLLPPRELAAFCRELAPRVPIVLDEVYLELCDGFREQTQIGLVREGLPIVIARSFSKMHGLAGHRIGYAITTPALAAALQKRQMSSVNFLGVAAARESLYDEKFHRWTIGKIRAGRDRYCALLQELGLRYTPSSGNFVFHEVKMPVEEYEAKMKERGFLVNWPHALVEPYTRWCRTSIGTDREMSELAAAMRAVFG